MPRLVWHRHSCLCRSILPKESKHRQECLCHTIFDLQPGVSASGLQRSGCDGKNKMHLEKPNQGRGMKHMPGQEVS